MEIISEDMLRHAIDVIGRTEGIQMDVDSLIDDVFILSNIYSTEQTFILAVNQIHHSLKQIVKTRTIGTELFGNLSNWRSFHFQSRRVNKQSADLRIVYQDTGDFIQVRGFGNRHLPQDFYQRIYKR